MPGFDEVEPGCELLAAAMRVRMLPRRVGKGGVAGMVRVQILTANRRMRCGD